MTVRKSTLQPYMQWETPTVSEVEEMAQLATERYKLASIFSIHTLLRINEGTPRMWRRGLKKKPDELSSIPYGQWVILVALGTGIFIGGVPRSTYLPQSFVQTYKDYLPPSHEMAKCFLGEASYTGQKRDDLAQMLGIEKGSLSRQMKSLPFYTYAFLLMYCGVPIESIFPRPEKVEMQASEEPGTYTVNYDVRAMERRYLGENTKGVTYERYLQQRELEDCPESRTEYVKCLKRYAALQDAFNQACAALGIDPVV